MGRLMRKNLEKLQKKKKLSTRRGKMENGRRRTKAVRTHRQREKLKW